MEKPEKNASRQSRGVEGLACISRCGGGAGGIPLHTRPRGGQAGEHLISNTPDMDKSGVLLDEARTNAEGQLTQIFNAAFEKDTYTLDFTYRDAGDE